MEPRKFNQRVFFIFNTENNIFDKLMFHLLPTMEQNREVLRPIIN